MKFLACTTEFVRGEYLNIFNDFTGGNNKFFPVREIRTDNFINKYKLNNGH